MADRFRGSSSGSPDSGQQQHHHKAPSHDLPAAEGSVGGGGGEQDRLLPIANVGRIMKQILPGNAKVSKEAKETIQECASEFISFVTGEASDRCRKEKRKTVNGDDICWALAELGFDDYVQPMKRYLSKYREYEAARAAAAGAGVGVGVFYPSGADDETMPLFGRSFVSDHFGNKGSSSSSSSRDPTTQYRRPSN